MNDLTYFLVSDSKHIIYLAIGILVVLAIVGFIFRSIRRLIILCACVFAFSTFFGAKPLSNKIVSGVYEMITAQKAKYIEATKQSNNKDNLKEMLDIDAYNSIVEQLNKLSNSNLLSDDLKQKLKSLQKIK